MNRKPTTEVTLYLSISLERFCSGNHGWCVQTVEVHHIAETQLYPVCHHLEAAVPGTLSCEGHSTPYWGVGLTGNLNLLYCFCWYACLMTHTASKLKFVYKQTNVCPCWDTKLTVPPKKRKKILAFSWKWIITLETPCIFGDTVREFSVFKTYVLDEDWSFYRRTSYKFIDTVRKNAFYSSILLRLVCFVG